MARYLTPAKISLLVLIELYCFEPIPNDAILSILSFVTSHVTDVDTALGAGRPANASADSLDADGCRWKRAERVMSLVLGIGDFETLLAPHKLIRGQPGRKLWDAFLQRLWLISSLDYLHGFFERLTHLVTPSPSASSDDSQDKLAPPRVLLSRTSPFGMFVRRSQMEFHRLRFHDAAELWRGFVLYRQPTGSYLRRRSPLFNRFSFDHVLLGLERDLHGTGLVEGLESVTYGDMLANSGDAPRLVSTDDVESLLEFQIEQVQQFGNRIPLAIKSQFQTMLRNCYLVPSLTHYLSFMDAWRAGDYPTAFDFLHRYFDYTMQNRDRLFYQYALMNLAVLQADFGCYKEALAAMLETVSTARENRDMTCLNFSLNWLFHFSCAHPQLVRDLDLGEGGGGQGILGIGKESLAYLRVKSREMDMWPLWSAVMLSEAKHGLAHGDSIATSLEYMVRSSQVMVEHNMTNMFGAQLGLQATLWDRLGISQLSSTVCNVFLNCHSRLSLFDDELRMSCRLAMAVAARGKYYDALQILGRLEGNPLRPWKPSQFWLKYRGIIKLRRDLHHGNLDGAEQLLSQLLQNRTDDIEPDLAFLIDTLHVECMAIRGDLRDAFVKVESMMTSLQSENKDVLLRVRLLLLKARLYDRCGRPRRGFTVAVRAATLSWKARLLPTLWESIGLVANVLTSLAEFAASAQLLSTVLPRALESDDNHMIARLYSLLADAHMGLAGKAPHQSSKRMESLAHALDALQKSFDNYTAIEDVRRQAEMMAKKAAIMKLRGDATLAADYAAAHVALRREAAVAMG